MLSLGSEPAGQPVTVLTPLVNSGGRSPEVVPGIQSGPSLERPASPTSVQEQPVHKKNRTADIEGDVVQEMVMDTLEDMENGEHGKGTAGVVGSDQGGKASYAHMVAKSGSDEERGKSAATLTDEEVVILENDVLVDRRGAIPSIEFSDRVHDQVDRNMQACTKGKEAASGSAGQEGNQCPEPSVPISESNLFGPWMVVDNRRRKPVGNGRAVEPVMQEGRGHRGSRFTALEVSDDGGLLRGSGEDVHGDPPMVEADARPRAGSMEFPRVTREKNSAYVASNPEKRTKNGRKNNSSPVVLPIVEGQEASVVSRKATGKGGNHSTVIIQEQNEKGLTTSMFRGGRRVGGLAKGNLGVHGVGLKAKRVLDVRRGASTSVSGFVANVVGELDKIAEDTGLAANTEQLMSEDDSSWSDFQNEDDGDPALLDPDGGADGQ
ncbi:hypothetical protein V6N13_129630 [Hibiscus sabdariffa]